MSILSRLRRPRLVLSQEERSQGEALLRLVAGYLPPTPIVVEGGAHIGRDTVKMAEAWPAGQVHAFEPIPRLFKQLERNTARLPNVSVYRLALGDRDGGSTMYVSGGASDGSSSLLRPKAHLDAHPDVTFTDVISVDTVTLDSWAAAHGVPRVDFLWLDLQGSEQHVLSASERVLPTISAVYTEVNLVEAYEGVALYDSFKEWLSARGFTVALEDIPWQDGGNVLFVRRGLPVG